MNSPKGKVHLVFAVKFDGRHKARLVVVGHLTPEPIENIYSGVVSLRNLRLVIFLGKLNNLPYRPVVKHQHMYTIFWLLVLNYWSRREIVLPTICPHHLIQQGGAQ